jgi:hypothetical protein
MVIACEADASSSLFHAIRMNFDSSLTKEQNNLCDDQLMRLKSTRLAPGASCKAPGVIVLGKFAVVGVPGRSPASAPQIHLGFSGTHSPLEGKG